MKKTLDIFWIASIAAAVNLHAQTFNENAVLLGTLAPPRGGESFKYSDIWGYAANGREYAIIGCFTGTSIIDVTIPTSPTEVAFIPGASSIWRDIKTHLQYAYVTHDANGNEFPAPGVQIIDLAQLPATAALANTYSATLDDGLAHNLYIDNGFAYIAGSRGSGRGCHILDLSDPINPVEVGSWSDRYWHDVVVKNDTLYGSAGLGSFVEIVDGRDKGNLKLISQAFYPGAYTHNAWMSGDNNYLAQTDESWDQPVNFWDMTDHQSPELVAGYTAGPGSIAHNAHVHGNLAVISYYYDGVKVLDISQRKAPVEVANFDTYPDDNYRRGTGYRGAWGAYPFLPSGNILVSDITYGLHVIEFNGTQAGYISGVIRNESTQSPLSDVNIELLNRKIDEGRTIVKVGIDGKYIFGAKPGTRSFKFTKAGYSDFVLSDVSIQADVVQEQDILMEPATTDVEDSPRLPSRLELLQNYPNPFNPSTTIRWRQPAAGVAQISVFNHLGQQVAEFENVEGVAGDRQFTIDLKNFASGIYFYRINMNGMFSEMKKMILMR